MGKPNIMILVPGYQVLGQEHALIRLAVMLRESGIGSSFLLHKVWGGDLIAPVIRQLGFECIMLPLGSLWSLRLSVRNPRLLINNVASLVLTTTALVRILKGRHFSHVVIPNITFSSYVIPALLFSNVLVIYRHGDKLPEHSCFHMMLTRFTFSRTDIHIANCNFIRDHVHSRHPDVLPIVIRNPAWGSDNPCQDSYIRDDGIVRLIFVGQLTKQKGLHLLLAAFAQIAEEHPNVVLDVVGPFPGVGKYQDDSLHGCIDSAVRLSAGRVLVHGYQSCPDKFFRHAHIHVCPSIEDEASPNVIAEAKSHGIPSIAFNVGGIPEMIRHKVDGYICRSVSASALADGITFFLNHPEQRKAAGIEAANSASTTFCLDEFRAKWVEVIESGRRFSGTSKTRFIKCLSRLFT